VVDFPIPVEPVARIRLHKHFNARSAQSRKDLAAQLRDATRGLDSPKKNRNRSGAGDDDEILALRHEIRRHPCHGCDDRETHSRWAERYHRLKRESDNLEHRVESRTNSIAREFDRVCTLLSQLDYLREGTEHQTVVTDAGKMLAGLYSESDLLAAEAIRRGLWNDLTPAELASVCAALVYESRSRDEGAVTPKVPRGSAEQALTEMVRLWADLEALEKQHHLSFLREPDLGFCWTAYRWASGKSLEAVLRDADMPAGDFVRWCKQLIDLLGQVASASERVNATSPVSANARAAVDLIRRGVVAYSSVG
jgi:ATP-dependent RNA helicase HelY